MTRLSGVEWLYVRRDIAAETQACLRAIGEHGYEGFALWAGSVEGPEASIHALYVPDQQGLRSEAGVLVMVGGEELHRLNVWLYEHGLTLIAQIHTHPDDAYHSETDDTYPIVAATGGLSLVIPHFGRGPFSLDRCAVFRRDIVRVRRRYLRLGKEELVERLLAVEQVYAEQEERWRQVNDDLLTWQLRVEAAETRPNLAYPAPLEAAEGTMPPTGPAT